MITRCTQLSISNGPAYTEWDGKTVIDACEINDGNDSDNVIQESFLYLNPDNALSRRGGG